MEIPVDSKGTVSRSKGSDGAKANKDGVVRNRKVYAHDMTEAEKFALQACLKAKNALSAIAVHIQEGKGCKPEIVKAALAIQSEAADVLFA